MRNNSSFTEQQWRIEDPIVKVNNIQPFKAWQVNNDNGFYLIGRVNATIENKEKKDIGAVITTRSAFLFDLPLFENKIEWYQDDAYFIVDKNTPTLQIFRYKYLTNKIEGFSNPIFCLIPSFIYEHDSIIYFNPIKFNEIL